MVRVKSVVDFIWILRLLLLSLQRTLHLDSIVVNSFEQSMLKKKMFLKGLVRRGDKYSAPTHGFSAFCVMSTAIEGRRVATIGREDSWKALKKRQELLKTHCREVLEQKRMLLEIISDEDYTKKIPAFFDAAPSAHVRHSLQHISRVLDLVGGHIEDATTLCYDDRERKNDIEFSRSKAIKLTDKMISILDEMQSEDFTLPVHAEFVGSATTGKKYAVESSIERELSFVAHHATHHLAMVNLMLKSGGYAVQKDIGLANSTRLHHSSMIEDKE